MLTDQNFMCDAELSINRLSLELERQQEITVREPLDHQRGGTSTPEALELTLSTHVRSEMPVTPLPRTRYPGNENAMRENRMQRIEPADDEEEEDDRSSDHLVNSGLICAACHVALSSTNLRDNNIHYEQTLACPRGHILCHRCVQRFAIQSDVGCLICATESQNSPAYSQSNSCHSSLDNIQSKASAHEEHSVQQKRAEEIYHRSRYPPTLSTGAFKMPYCNNIKATNSNFEWGTDHGDTREDSMVYGDKHQRNSYYNINGKDEPGSSNSELRINGQMITECSRRPIRCPRLDCAKTVALSALTHHFLFDHPEVPVLSVEPGAKNTLLVSLASLTYGSSKCLALLLVSGKLSGTAATLFSGNQVSNPKYRNRLPLPILAARLKSTNQRGTEDAAKAAGEGRACGDIIIAWIAGLDFSGVLCCSIQAVDGFQSEVFRSLTYSGPVNSLRKAQRPHEILKTGDCLVLHEGLISQFASECANFNVIVH